MTEEKKRRIRELAEAAFDATERYNRLAAASASGTIEERRLAFVELNLAKANAVETKAALDSEVGAFADPPRGASRPFGEPMINLNWLEDIFGVGRKK